jgi:hypothetical protein
MSLPVADSYVVTDGFLKGKTILLNSAYNIPIQNLGGGLYKTMLPDIYNRGTGGYQEVTLGSKNSTTASVPGFTYSFNATKVNGVESAQLVNFNQFNWLFAEADSLSDIATIWSAGLNFYQMVNICSYELEDTLQDVIDYIND